MSGLRKRTLADRIEKALRESGTEILSASFASDNPATLPWSCELQVPPFAPRRFVFYFWTIGHGGKTRAADEYRIQTKMPNTRRLQFGRSTTLLLGYYSPEIEAIGSQPANEPRGGIEVFVAWDSVQHLRLGARSSCQVSLRTIYEAYKWGFSAQDRSISGNRTETIVAFRPESLAEYAMAAAGGHDHLNVEGLKEQIALGRLRQLRLRDR